MGTPPASSPKKRERVYFGNLLCRICHNRGPDSKGVCNWCRWEWEKPRSAEDPNEVYKVEYDRDWFESTVEGFEDVSLTYVGPCVYFIRSVNGGPVKIGFSQKPIERLKSLQGANSEPLEIVRLVRGDRYLEKDLHRYLKASRLQGEWFEPCDEVLELIG